jgi:hypothetical protein
MTARDGAMRLYGTAVPPAPYRMLRAGPLEARLENGNLRYIRFDGVEVLRALSYIVRDRDWGTLAPAMSGIWIEADDDRFFLSYGAIYVSGEAHLTLRAEIEGTAEGSLRFEVEATPDRDFETNRCGFTILHAINGVAGAPVTVEHCNGVLEKTRFPDLIEPWQPFQSIRALTHRPAPHLLATCRMTGDVFEMEDQRNWSDASYKTYVRPLALPWPYHLPAGKVNRQCIDLRVELARDKVGGSAAASAKAPVRVDLGAVSAVRFPKVGLVVAPEEIRGTLEHLACLAEVAPPVILCHFDPTAGHRLPALAGFAQLQRAYPARYELEYVVACEGDLGTEFERLSGDVRMAGFQPDALAVCPSVDRGSTPPGSAWPACPPLEAIYEAARRHFPGIPLGGGMFSYFTELNRKRPPVALLDFVTHGTNPIVHAADDESVMETLETLPHITRSARAIIGDSADYRLGLTSIGMRQNPYGSRTFDNPFGERLCMAHDDPRQRGLFAAAWTIGYAARIAPAGIERWVPGAFTGRRGIVAEDSGVLLPVGKAVADLCRFSGARVIACKVSDPRRLAAVAVRDGECSMLLVANLTDREVLLDCEGRYPLGAYDVQRLSVADGVFCEVLSI